MGTVNDFLVAYLDSIDERLLTYLDDNEELRLDTVQRLRFYATALLDGSITPDAVAEDRPDFFALVPAFVAAYAPEGIEGLQEKASFLESPTTGGGAPLTGADRAYLAAVETVLDMYPDMRTTDKEE
jgi:hypothetical protein